GALAAAQGHLPGQDNPEDVYGFKPLPARSEPGFDHVVVLMFENRSFDHVLGRLYPDGAPRGQAFEGLQHGDHHNLAPDGSRVDAHVYEGSTDWVMSQPEPDPGEFYTHVNTQWFGNIDPPQNGQHGWHPPWNAPADAANLTPTMSGFVLDYDLHLRTEHGIEPTSENYAAVMGGFSPEMLPVFSTLARSFAVYDHWHCAVPSQTFCNRSFFHASTSHGFVTNDENGGMSKWLTADHGETIFNRLEEAGLSWRVYYDAEQVVSLTGMLHAPVLADYWLTNFRSMEQFHEDASTGNLPVYSFIEPRMVFDHNDMHPPEAKVKVERKPGDPPYSSAMSDMRAGEALLAEVYGAVRAGASTAGSNALNTLLLVTFDEHGGIYDHVPPPTATPPSGKPEPGEWDFTFDRLGGRVPAIAVSAYTRAGSVINDPMHHGALVKTLCDQHGLEPLTYRDAEAPSLRNAVHLETPRQPALWPDVTPVYVPKNPEAQPTEPPTGSHANNPLTSPARSLIGLLLARYEPEAPVPTTFADAYDALHTHGESLFGVRD
ncbi:MAG TPA: alkaline phosphatase family protein, partial [Nocardioides sp.]|nr:alkaline phosphatase family protein [Nocardioides sp.]